MTNFWQDEVAGLVFPNPIKHLTRTTIQHWQLRDLVCCDNREQYYYVCQNHVCRYNTRTKQIQRVLNLEFLPTSMTADHGFVAAGGHKSELHVNDLSTNTVLYAGTVGGSVNNAVHIAQHNNETRLLCSNNDMLVKIYSLPDMTNLTNVQCPVPINYTAVSPDGSQLVCVGDSTQSYLYTIGPTGYHKVGSFVESHDAGMSAAWNYTSTSFAVASQDGSVCVWDVRSHKLQAKIQAEQSHHIKGACRSVKFAPSSPIDLLVFTEHVSYLHVVDSRNFARRQVIRLCSPNQDAHISGVSFAPDSSRLFVGLEDCVAEFMIDSVQQRSFACGSLL